MARRLALTAALVVALLPVTGAGGADTQQAPKRGGTVVFGPYRAPTCLNPFLSQCSTGYGAMGWIVETVLPGAFRSGPDSIPRPRLVSEVRHTTSPFTLTYSIRRDARWSDGRPVTAADFVFTHHGLLRMLPPDDSTPHRLVSSIRPLDSKTVRLVLRQPVAGWRIGLFQFVAPRHALAGQDLERVWLDGIDDPRTGDPIGSGPFVVRSWGHRPSLTMVRNARYWGSHTSHLNRLVLRFCTACGSPPPQEVLALLGQGDVDVSLSRDPAITPDLRRIPDVRVSAYLSSGWDHLAFRLDTGGSVALRDRRVRRALAYGIDRGEIVKRVFGVIDPSLRPSQSAAFLNTSRYYRPNWDRYAYRPALARRLLEQAGCRRGLDRVYSCGDSRLSFRFFTIASSTYREKGIELMRSQLRRIGVEVIPQFTADLNQTLLSGAFDAILFGWFATGAIAGTSVFGCGGDENFTGYCRRLVTDDFDRAERIVDPTEYARALDRIDRRLAADVPVLPLYQLPFVLAFKSHVRGIVPSPDNPLWNAEDWWLDD